MFRRTRIKFCGLVRAGDVDTAVALGVDAIGFVFFAPSKRVLDADAALALRRRLPSFVQAVGLFVNEDAQRITSVAAQVGLDTIQLHGDETPRFARALGRRYWRAHRIDAGFDLRARLAAWKGAEFHLLDSASAGYGGSGHPFDWSTVVSAGVDEFDATRLIVAGGLDDGNVGQAIERFRPFAVDSSSGIQSADPRCKDAAKMTRFVASVRVADEALARSIRAPNHESTQ